MYRRLFAFSILLGLYLSLSAQLQWPQPAKMMEHRDVTWNNSSVNISENVFHAWAQVDGQTSKIYLQATNSVGDSLWQIMPDPNTNNQFTQTSPNIITTSDNCLIISWIEHNPYPNIRLKAQKINQTGQRLWGENGVYLTDSFTCITNNYLTAFDGFIPDPDGGAYLCFKNSENLILLKVNTTGSVAWQQQIANNPQAVKICRTYPDGLYIFTSNYNSTQNNYAYYRFSPTGDLLFTGHTVYAGYDAQIHVFADNSFVIGDPLSNSNITKYSPSGEPLWYLTGNNRKSMTFINDSEFYLLKKTTNNSHQLSIQKYNSSGDSISEEAVLPSAYLISSGISPTGKLIIFYYDPVLTHFLRLQILNQDNTFAFDQGIIIGNPSLLLEYDCQYNWILLNDRIYMTTYNQTFSRHLFDYLGSNYQQQCIVDPGYNYSEIDTENFYFGRMGFPNYFFADADNFTMFQQYIDLRMYKIDSDGNNILPYAGKTIVAENYNSPNSITRVHKSPAQNYIISYRDNANYWRGKNINNMGETNFNYEDLYPYFHYENRPDCIWAFYQTPIYQQDYYVHKLYNETTFDNTITELCFDKGLAGIFGQDLLFFKLEDTGYTYNIYMHHLSDDLIPEPSLPTSGLQVASNLYQVNVNAFHTSQGLLLFWVNNFYELRIQIIRYSDFSLVYPLVGHVIMNNSNYSDHQIYGFENNIFNVIYRDASTSENRLILQKYALIDNEFFEQLDEEGLLISDSVYSFTAGNFGNNLGISYLRGYNVENTSLFFTRFSNNTDEISNNLSLGYCANYFKPQLYPIDNQNTYLVWRNSPLPPFENYYTYLVQKIDLSQLPVNDQAISPSQPLTLNQNYPNPFNPETQISFTLPTSGKVTLEIFNIKGQRVTTLLNEQLESGQHNITWKGTNSSQNPVSSGIYFYKLSTPNKSITRKMLLVK